jgi:hypothetical protein
MHRVLERSRESRLSLAAKAGKLIDKLSNRHIQIGVDRPAVNIPTRQGEPCARRKAGGEAAMTAQYDFSRERVIGETCDWRKFLARELTQRVRKGQVMSGNVDGQISHGEQQLFEELGNRDFRRVTAGSGSRPNRWSFQSQGRFGSLFPVSARDRRSGIFAVVMQGKADNLGRCPDQKIFQRRRAKRSLFEKWGDRRSDWDQSDSCFYLAAIGRFVQTTDR